MRERVGLNSLALVVFLIAAFFSTACFAQQKKEPADSLIRLLEANSAQLLQIDTVAYRKVVGPARFFHNNTYLLCDTALWNVSTNIINAIGHVQILQENTFLKSDAIEYVVNENLAKCRGQLVELFDKEGNILRTNFLDYNTKDSIATFYNGGALINNDGNLIESNNGMYQSKEKLFSFIDSVQMFADSLFIISDKIDYRTDLNKAYFGRATTAWQNENMLTANSGEFDRPADIITFDKDGYILTREQEIWADLLKYFRKSGNADLFNNVQMLDTVQTAIALADKVTYRPSPMVVELTQKPAVGLYTVEKGVCDTLFMASDTIRYYTIRYCDIDSSIISQAKERKKLSDIDPISIMNEKERVARLAAEKRREEAGKRPESTQKAPDGAGGAPAAPNAPVAPNKVSAQTKVPAGKRKNIGKKPRTQVIPKSTEVDSLRTVQVADSLRTVQVVDSSRTVQVTDSLKTATVDSLRVSAADSLKISLMDSLKTSLKDSLKNTVVLPKDTTQVTFIDAFHHVRMYRSDLQGLCDSLVYTGIDSIARFYKDPIMWNDTKNQFMADSIQAAMKKNALDKINLLSNAYIISQEDSIHFNQIKSPEMSAHFANNDLYRYDALGGASAIFYLQEDSIITVMNQKESKMLSASIKDRQIQKIKYIENIKNDALPVFNLPMDQQRLRGFVWRDKDRPKSRNEVTDRVMRVSQRNAVEKTPFPQYLYSKVYFPHRRDSLMIYKAELDSIRRAEDTARELKRQKDLQAKQLRDSLGRDTTVDKNMPVVPDTLAVKTDVASDSGMVDIVNTAKTKKQLNAEKRLLKKAEKLARKEEKRLKKEKRRENRKKMLENKKQKRYIQKNKKQKSGEKPGFCEI
ncbi:MAG: OstA-like protein [Bacteroidales bacterium]